MSERKKGPAQKPGSSEKSSPHKEGGGLGKLFGDIANQTSQRLAEKE